MAGVVVGAAVVIVAMVFGLWCGWRLSRGLSPVPELLPTLADVRRALTRRPKPNPVQSLAERLPQRIKP